MKTPILAGALLACCVAFAPAATDDAHVLAQRAAAEQPANETRTATEVVRGGQRTILGVYEIAGTGSNGAPGTVQPGAGTYDERTGRASADVQINLPPNGHPTTATANVSHDAASVVYPRDGSVLVTYGAASTYAPYQPPQSWACLHNQFCQPYKRVSIDGNGDLAEALARAPEQLLPSSGLSELSYATLGENTILAGQQQTAPASGEPGAQGYVSYRAGGHFDTAGDGDGLYTIARAPNDDGYVEFAIAQAHGAGAISLDADGASCMLSHLPATDARAAAEAFIEYANAACPAFHAKFDLVLASYAPLEPRDATTIGVASRNRNVLALPNTSSVRLHCDGGIVCTSPNGPNTIYDVRGSGLHRHFLFGGVSHAGRYIYDLLDIQQVTGSWYGPEHNSYALALACFRTEDVHDGVWRWTDCGGGHPFDLRPGVAPEDRLQPGSPYLIEAPHGGFPRDMSPFITNWSMEAQAPKGTRAEPVISSESLTPLANGSLLIAYACTTASGADGVCYVELDRAGHTLRAGLVADPAGGGSLASIRLTNEKSGTVYLAALVGNGPRWGCAATGACALLYRFDAGNGSWTQTGMRALGGIDNAGFAGTVAPAEDGFVMLYRQLQSQTQSRIMTYVQHLP
jgi:hypothetical protein